MTVFQITHSYSRVVVPVCLITLLVFFCNAQAQTPFDTITTIDGQIIEGSIQAITATGDLIGDSIENLSVDKLLLIKRPASVEPRSSANIIYLSYGGKLFADSAVLNNDQVVARTSIGEIKLPVETIRAVIFQPKLIDDFVSKAIANPSKQLDKVIATTPDGPRAASGLVESVTSDKVAMDVNGESKTVSMPIVIGVVIADLGLKTPSGSFALCSLIDGSTAKGQITGLSDGTLQLRIGAAKLSIPWKQIASISVSSDRMVYVSELEPVEYFHEPIVTTEQPWQRDLSVAGNPLSFRLKGQRNPIVFPKGIGMHSYTRLVFANNQFTHFAATVGIDSETQRKGNCVFVVRGDGVTLWSKEISATDPPIEINIEIVDIKEIALVVEPGSQLDLADHANWANARFLKTD